MTQPSGAGALPQTAAEPPNLANRLDPIHLRQRQAIEAEAMALRSQQRARRAEDYAAAILRTALRATGLLARGRRNARRISVTENEARLPDLPRALHGLRVLQIADPHLDVDEAFPHLLAAAVAGIRCDLCVLTGDYRYRTDGNTEPALAGLGILSEALPAPAYAVLGNHDSVTMVPGMEALGYRLLMNEAVFPTGASNHLALAGIDDPHYYRTDNLQRACQGLDEQTPLLLLAHSPEAYRHAAACGVDLMLAGHTHGGQICLPQRIPAAINAACPRRYASGAWRYGSMLGYTSRGAGSSMVDVRFYCPAEVVIHTLWRQAQ